MTATMTRTDIPVEDDDELVPVFVYGTLRYGEGNYSWCQDAVRYVLRNCATEGRIYWVYGTQGYPVAKLDEDGKIKGDILWFEKDHPDYRDVVRMELGAGYEIRNVRVECEGGEHRDCLAFHYIGKPNGRLISSGDWVAASSGRR